MSPRRRKRNRPLRVLLVLAILAGGAWAGYEYWWKDDPAEADDDVPGAPEPLHMRTPDLKGDGTGTVANAPTTRPNSGLSAVEAKKAMQRGIEMIKKGELIEARTALSAAYFSDHLTPAEAQSVRGHLAGLADLTIFSAKVYPDDPYAFRYTVEPNDMLIKLDRKLRLQTPVQLIMRINNIRNADYVRAGRTLKLIRGQVHALVDKSERTMDLYLKRGDLPITFVARVPVGVGKAMHETPSGRWRVKLGGKIPAGAPWNPPPNSGLSGKIAFGDPEYPLGPVGRWIGLVGADEDTRHLTGYGIHGTNEPETVGQAASLGCIRLKNEDIALVYALLYDKWSRVDIRP